MANKLIVSTNVETNVNIFNSLQWRPTPNKEIKNDLHSITTTVFSALINFSARLVFYLSVCKGKQTDEVSKRTHESIRAKQICAICYAEKYGEICSIFVFETNAHLFRQKKSLRDSRREFSKTLCYAMPHAQARHNKLSSCEKKIFCGWPDA